mmetsp:Transcript_12426/g.1860  ORF Transcript_12426/g.1860 Transcript_12426/m.1860 type:complete len:81 (-) Transcript_12426:1026-1268(-)
MDRTPLHIACIKGYYGIAKLLINAGADIDQTDIDFYTPLHHAVENSHCKIVRLILKHNPKVDVINRLGKLPLDLATSKEC